jgi:hypothetical protein
MQDSEREPATNGTPATNNKLTPRQQLLNDLWGEHLGEEFKTRDTESTVDSAKLPIAGRESAGVVESSLTFRGIDSHSARLAHDLDCD